MQDETDVAGAAVPAQRIPAHDGAPVPDDTQAWASAGPHVDASVTRSLPAFVAPPSRRRGGAGVALLITLVLLLGAGTAVVATADRPTTALRHVTGADAARPAATAPLTPFEQATKALDAQAAALLRGDQRGWLAAVDPAQPALRKRYQDLYRTFKALHVTQFEYHASSGTPAAGGSVVVQVQIAYCMSASTCPAFSRYAGLGPPRIAQRLTLKPAKAGYVIGGLAKAAEPTEVQPTAWEAGDLVFAQGRRVTVGAPGPLAGRLREVVAAADRAAKVDDRIARAMRNPQQRYRVFLATDRDWRTWYGGDLPGYAVAYTIRLNQAGSDVVLHMSQLSSRRELEITVQHEMAHVATLSNLRFSDRRDMWLMEGIAEYTGWLPLHLGSDLTVPAVRTLFRGGDRPKSIVQKPLAATAGQRTVNTFYGLGHWAVQCLVTKYGDQRTLEFVRLRLRLSKPIDDASRAAFGKPFATVDKACVSWIAGQVG